MPRRASKTEPGSEEQDLSAAKLLRRRTQQSWEELNAITKEVADLAEGVCTQVEQAAEAIQRKGKAATGALKGKLRLPLHLRASSCHKRVKSSPAIA